MKKNRSSHQSGSALLITLMCVALLMVLILAMVAVVRMEIRATQLAQQRMQAQGNARLAMELAIGALQETTGPDMRVTAPADMAVPPGVSITPDTFNLTTGNLTSSGTSGEDAQIAIDTWWGTAKANRHWVGAFRNINTSSFDPNNPSAFNAAPGLQRWLVSGNESSPGTYQPGDPISGLAVSAEPGEPVSSGGKSYQVLVKAAAGVETAADLDRMVTAPQVSISNQVVQLGHYAWWVGDEGIKARANLVDPYAGESSSATNPANEARRQSAQRPVLEIMPDLASTYPVNDPNLSRPLVWTQMGFLNADPLFGEAVADRFHELTLTSRGVLADAKHGGLKGDFTHILSRSSTSEFRNELETAFQGANVVPGSGGNTALSTEASLFAEIPTSLSSNYSAVYPGSSREQLRDVSPTLLSESSTWEQLWSFYNIGNGTGDSPAGAFLSPSLVQARLPTDTRTGITPVVVQGKVFYRMRNDNDQIVVDINPLVVLANPYPFTLRGDFIIQYKGMTPAVMYGDLGSITDPTDEDLNDIVTKSLSNAMPGNCGMGNVRLTAKATGIPPGEAQIFTVDPDADLTVTGSSDTHEVAMLPTYDPTVFLTYTSTKTVPAGTNVWVGLKTGNRMFVYAYMGDVAVPNQFTYVFNQDTTAYFSSTGLDTNTVSSGSSNIARFRVFPMPWQDGEKRGGAGITFSLHDAYNRSSPQQSPFLSTNYRTMKIMYVGASAYSHPLEWSIGYGFRGNRDQPYDNLPLDYYSANLLLPPGGAGIPNTTRWGLVNTGGLPSYNVPPPGIDPSGKTALVNLMFDLPQPGSPPTSLGQLQHFNLAGIPNADDNGGSPQTWQSNYPIANSYLTARVARDLLFYATQNLSHHYDGSWLWNEILWDRFTFSSFPISGDFDFDDPADRLVNARYRPFRNPADVAHDDPAQYRGVHKPAENLLVDGAFNINSTSVDAWKAVLAGLRDVPTGSETDSNKLSAPFPRILNPLGGSDDAEAGNTENAWTGFRNLDDAELQALAEEIVLQIRLRGPFLSLADFVNRKLTPGRVSQSASASPDTYRLGLTGALQSALDRVINLPTHIPNTPNGNNSTMRDKTRAYPSSGWNGPFYGDVEYRTPTRISGFPGFMMQGDILSAIGPSLAARSDTFTIRTYGDTVTPDGTPQARAWCEAVVQRIPDFVDDTNVPDARNADLTAVNQLFGRRYEVISFRWLNAEDI